MKDKEIIGLKSAMIDLGQGIFEVSNKKKNREKRQNKVDQSIVATSKPKSNLFDLW